jgi:hypothetical protein
VGAGEGVEEEQGVPVRGGFGVGRGGPGEWKGHGTAVGSGVMAADGTLRFLHYGRNDDNPYPATNQGKDWIPAYAGMMGRLG